MSKRDDHALAPCTRAAEVEQALYEAEEAYSRFCGSIMFLVKIGASEMSSFLAKALKGCALFTELIEQMKSFEREDFMDKKMAKVTQKIKHAEKEVKGGHAKAATKDLKGAEKENVRLTKIDRDIRDPFIDKCKKEMRSAKR